MNKILLICILLAITTIQLVSANCYYERAYDDGSGANRACAYCKKGYYAASGSCKASIPSHLVEETKGNNYYCCHSAHKKYHKLWAGVKCCPNKFVAKTADTSDDN